MSTSCTTPLPHTRSNMTRCPAAWSVLTLTKVSRVRPREVPAAVARVEWPAGMAAAGRAVPGTVWRARSTLASSGLPWKRARRSAGSARKAALTGAKRVKGRPWSRSERAWVEVREERKVETWGQEERAEEQGGGEGASSSFSTMFAATDAAVAKSAAVVVAAVAGEVTAVAVEVTTAAVVADDAVEAGVVVTGVVVAEVVAAGVVEAEIVAAEVVEAEIVASETVVAEVVAAEVVEAKIVAAEVVVAEVVASVVVTKGPSVAVWRGRNASMAWITPLQARVSGRLMAASSSPRCRLNAPASVSHTTTTSSPAAVARGVEPGAMCSVVRAVGRRSRGGVTRDRVVGRKRVRRSPHVSSSSRSARGSLRWLNMGSVARMWAMVSPLHSMAVRALPRCISLVTWSGRLPPLARAMALPATHSTTCTANIVRQTTSARIDFRLPTLARIMLRTVFVRFWKRFAGARKY